MISGIKVGDIFIAANGGTYGHLITDVTTFSYCDDVVTTPFTHNGLEKEKAGNRIDFYKLTQIHYYRPNVLPEWVSEFNV